MEAAEEAVEVEVAVLEAPPQATRPKARQAAMTKAIAFFMMLLLLSIIKSHKHDPPVLQRETDLL